MGNLLDLLFTESSAGLVEIKKEAKLLGSVREIIERDPGKTVKGEKVKEMARKELSYIYFYTRREAFEGYSDEERKQIIKERVALPEKWKPDELVVKAIKDLKEDNISRFEKLLNLALRNLDNYSILFEKANEYYTGLIAILDDTDVDGLTETQMKDRKEALEQAQSFFKAATSSVGDLEKGYKLIESLLDSIKQTKKKEGKKRISASETDKSLYKMEGEEY